MGADVPGRQAAAGTGRLPLSGGAATVVWTYSFKVWPDEDHGWPGAVFDAFVLMRTEQERRFTEAEFNAFRTELRGAGLNLEAIERRQPYCAPEPVL
jgi:hypothetical protein